MSHINIKTGNLELPYIDKIYITEDKASYISLNTGKVVYLENNQLKSYQFDMGRKPYKMLSYLMENNGDFVPSDTIYYDVFGQNITEKQDSTVDEVRRTLWKIACIKNSDLKIKKHSGGETSFPGYTLSLPEQEVELSSKYSLMEFIKKEEQLESDLLRAVMYCYCKWGACTYDEIPQNTNTCEGILSLMAAKDKGKYFEVIEEAMEYLKEEIADKGLKSKSLDEETVVPTAMYLYLNKKIQKVFDDKTNDIANRLWSVRTHNGWGLYVKKMEKFANIGCTYWAIMGLEGYANISEELFQKYLRSLFKYENAYAYGATINDVNPRVPSLYATSMMYIIYNHLSECSQMSIGKLYDSDRALEYIVQNFDNPFLLTEQEGINGVEVDGKISVHTVGWNHITVNYSLTALSIAFEKGCFSEAEMNEILYRIEQLVTDNSEKNEQIMFWSAPTMAIDKGNRGKLIFPTMHLIMGLSRIREAVERLDR